MAFGTQKLEKTWELQAVVLEKRTGVSATSGEDWFSVKVGGFTFFSVDLYNMVNEGDKVIVKGTYTGDRYSKKTGGYSPQQELEGCIVLEGAFVDNGVKLPHLNGNGRVEKGQPA